MATDPLGVTTDGPCPLVPGIWTSSRPTKLPVTVQHARLGAASVGPQQDPGYLRIMAQIQDAFAAFDNTFESQAAYLRTVMFSADGDMLHDYMDCVFQVRLLLVYGLALDSH